MQFTLQLARRKRPILVCVQQVERFGKLYSCELSIVVLIQHVEQRAADERNPENFVQKPGQLWEERPHQSAMSTIRNAAPAGKAIAGRYQFAVGQDSYCRAPSGERPSDDRPSTSRPPVRCHCKHGWTVVNVTSSHHEQSEFYSVGCRRNNYEINTRRFRTKQNVAKSRCDRSQARHLFRSKEWNMLSFYPPLVRDAMASLPRGSAHDEKASACQGKRGNALLEKRKPHINSFL